MHFLGGKGGRCVRPSNLPPSCAVIMKSWNFKFLQPSGPLQACNGTALSFILHITANRFLNLKFLALLQIYSYHENFRTVCCFVRIISLLCPHACTYSDISTRRHIAKDDMEKTRRTDLKRNRININLS